jgi:hypothetical protein
LEGVLKQQHQQKQEEQGAEQESGGRLDQKHSHQL